MRRSDRAARRHFLRMAALAPAALAGAACESVLPGGGPPPRLFQLTPKTTFRPGLPRVDWQLGLEVPFAPTGLNTTRIALQRTPFEVQYYGHVNWTDRAPLMVQTLMIESFEASRHIVAVGRESIGLRADYLLRTELREFQAEYFGPGYAGGGPPVIRTRVNVKLVQMPRRAIVGTKDIENTRQAQADRIEAVVDAFDEALGRVMKDLVEWTLVEGERARGGS